MENLKQFKTHDLEGAQFNLNHAKRNRPGGLLVGERVALQKIDAELARRAINR